MSTSDQRKTTDLDRESKDPLNAVEPVGKSRRFRLLLPVITAKIERGVEHAEIIKALAEQGLELTQGTYFSYLKRYRSSGAGRPQQTSPAECVPELPKPPAPPPASVTTASTPARPKTFDYDPRGIHPDLLK